MSEEETQSRVLFSVVLGDANILYSRVLRDYLLYAMVHQLIRVRWSDVILAEATRHLIDNNDGFDQESADRLITAMNGTLPTTPPDFPAEVMAAVGIDLLTADALLSTLIEEAGEEMLKVHRTAVSRLRGGTDESTIVALKRARAFRTADLIAALLDRF